MKTTRFPKLTQVKTRLRVGTIAIVALTSAWLSACRERRAERESIGPVQDEPSQSQPVKSAEPPRPTPASATYLRVQFDLARARKSGLDEVAIQYQMRWVDGHYALSLNVYYLSITVRDMDVEKLADFELTVADGGVVRIRDVATISRVDSKDGR